MKNSLHNRVFTSIANNRISELTDKLGETALDSWLTDSLLKDIPLFGTAITIWKTGNDIRAYHFTKKVIRFLMEIENASFEERQAFIKKCQPDDEREELGESILFILDSAKDVDSATYLGRNFTLLVKNDISEHTFYMNNHIIANLTPHIVQQIEFCYQFEVAPGLNSSMHYLHSLGLLDMRMKPYRGSDGEVEFDWSPKINRSGRHFYDTILNPKSIVQPQALV